MRRASIIIALSGFALLVASYVPVGGGRLLGFRYVVPVDNRCADFPNTVKAVDGRRISLDDGRVLLVDSAVTNYLVQQLRDQDRVNITDGVLYVPRTAGYCGFAFPQRCQLVTIPLFQEQLKGYRAEQIGHVWPAEQK